jgi:putative FmdB family regulatory protein
MPIYEYRCAACGHELEALQRFADAPLSTCPACSKDTLTKLLSAAGFQLKGSGWYATDFKNSGAKPAPAGKDSAKPEAKTDSTAGTDSNSAGDTKSESKTEAKTEAKTETKSVDKPATPAGTSTSGS